MKIVYLVLKAVYDTKMSRVRFQQIQAIGERAPVVWTGPGWTSPMLSPIAAAVGASVPPWNSSLPHAENVARIEIGADPVAHNRRVELVVVYGVDDLGDMPCPVATQFNEAYDTAKVDEYVRSNGITLVIFHHQNDMGRYWWWKRDKIVRVHVPHCADVTTYYDYGLDKDIDILVAGNLNDYYYPFRYRLRGLALGWFRKRGYRVTVLRHPGYTLPPRAGTVVGQEFAKILNRTKLVFTCSMRYNYALAKYSEIALCKSLAVGALPGGRKEFFRETILNVEPWMTDAQITRVVEDVLDDETGLLAKKTAAAYDRTLVSYTMGSYTGRFLRAATEFLGR